MKINFSAILLDLHDKQLMQPVATPGEVPHVPATLAWVASEALLRATDEKDGQRKYKLFSLAMKVGKGGDIDLKAEDVALLKKLIGEQFAPLVVGRAFDLLGEGEQVS
jgi:hypothetical protein